MILRKGVTRSPCDPHFISRRAVAAEHVDGSVRRASGFVQTAFPSIGPAGPLSMAQTERRPLRVHSSALLRYTGINLEHASLCRRKTRAVRNSFPAWSRGYGRSV